MYRLFSLFSFHPRYYVIPILNLSIIMQYVKKYAIALTYLPDRLGGVTFITYSWPFYKLKECILTRPETVGITFDVILLPLKLSGRMCLTLNSLLRMDSFIEILPLSVNKLMNWLMMRYIITILRFLCSEISSYISLYVNGHESCRHEFPPSLT